MTEQKYRVTFEMVDAIGHPQAYRGDKPCMTAEQVPESWWHFVERQSNDFESVQSQYHGLVAQSFQGELIRKPTLEQTALAWERIEP